MLVQPPLDKWLPKNHLAPFIAQLVDHELNLARFYTSHAKAKGQPPYDPRLMLRIVLLGYCVGGAVLPGVGAFVHGCGRVPVADSPADHVFPFHRKIPRDV
jgi:hypothetical protein